MPTPADHIGKWVEIDTPEGRTFYAKVIAIDEQPGSTIYTVHQFPAGNGSPIHTFSLDTPYNEQPLGEYPDLPAGTTLDGTINKHGGWDQPWRYCGDRKCWECSMLGLTD